jgi:hypothetical protein
VAEEFGQVRLVAAERPELPLKRARQVGVEHISR